MTRPPFYYFFCNHGTQGGIGFAFPNGFYNGKEFQRNFYAAYNIYKMLNAADQFPGLKVSLEFDSFAYEQVALEDPDCIAKLKEYIRAGKVGIAGGTYGQPLGQDYGWEPNIRQLTWGREVIKEVLDYNVEAFLVEEQWFHPQLPQLLQQSGFKYASLQNQNSGQVKPMKEALINWVGIDGTKIPTIPANDLLVSCVRQYTDYTAFADRLGQYEQPLLFQWIELWVPGMDWGASATPFAKAIEQVMQWQGKPVTLEDFFQLELGQRKLKDVYIPLDESNYANDWYQGGGWGYDGDKVIIEDKKTESALIAYEIWAALADLCGKHSFPTSEWENRWKRIMVLQNHDFSVARNYRAITEEGLVTEAGYLGVVEYQRLRRECREDLQELLVDGNSDVGSTTETLSYYSNAGFAHTATLEFEVKEAPEANLRLIQDGREVPHQVQSSQGGTVKGLLVANMPALGVARLDVCRTEVPRNEKAPQTGDYADLLLADDRIEVTWESGTWTVIIKDKVSGQVVRYRGFTGPISKQNEHNYLFPALSPAHEKFSFSFDGTVHSPDQLTDVRACIEERGPVQSTLLLRSDLLTLHTTETPVAFAEVRVSVNHITGEVSLKSHLYTGVYLGFQCYAELEHDLPNAHYYRDFPFGEEETHIEDVYPNSYTRVTADSETGFVLVHPGIQRAHIRRNESGGMIRHLVARDKLFGEYSWDLSLHFGNFSASEAMKLSRVRSDYPMNERPLWIAGDYLDVNHEDILFSTMYKEKDRLLTRFVNYSDSLRKNVQVSLRSRFQQAYSCDLMGNRISQLKTNQIELETIIHLQTLRPWQVITLELVQ